MVPRERQHSTWRSTCLPLKRRDTSGSQALKAAVSHTVRGMAGWCTASGAMSIRCTCAAALLAHTFATFAVGDKSNGAGQNVPYASLPTSTSEFSAASTRNTVPDPPAAAEHVAPAAHEVPAPARAAAAAAAAGGAGAAAAAEPASEAVDIRVLARFAMEYEKAMRSG